MTNRTRQHQRHNALSSSPSVKQYERLIPASRTMDPYLQGLIEARKDALSCLKSSLDNVNHILRIVDSLNRQISANGFVESNNDLGNNAPTSSPPPPATGVIGTNHQLTCSTGMIGNELRRATILPADGSSARTTEFQGRSLRERVRYEVAAAETLQERAEESKDKTRREPDTSPAKDAFTPVDHIKVELMVDDVVNVDKPSVADSTKVSGHLMGSSIASSDDDFMETFSLDERLQMLADKQKNEDSSCETSNRRSTRLQPMVRLEVLDDEDLQNSGKSNKGKVGRPRRRRGSDEFLTDEEYQEKKRQYARNPSRNRRMRRKPVRIIRDEPWPSRIQPKRPAKPVSAPVTVEIKDEVNYDYSSGAIRLD